MRSPQLSDILSPISPNVYIRYNSLCQITGKTYKGWKSIIPIYNVFVQYKFTWNTKVFWLLIVLEVIGNLIGGNGSGILYVISIILLLAGAIIYIIQFNNLSKAFGHGVGFTIGLIFLEPIFTMILGFGSSEYKGNPTTTN
ncbi:MAG: DUF5684 domain-containing protein [Lachnospiraceae bacterium]|nr:DUF5684 domain-containing protein [Lachnospiraceae bacterium]